MLEQYKTFNNTLLIFTKFESVRITFMRNYKRWMQKIVKCLHEMFVKSYAKIAKKNVCIKVISSMFT